MSEMSTAPRVFLSHASEDKKRFVLEFATRLRAKGVDAWVDRWEIIPGDSLVEKIFDEGLKSAQAVIIVVSANSVNKPWVREELSASVVSRIQKGTRLIPVVLDGVEVPEALKSTVWVKVPDLAAYDDALGSVVAAVFDHRPKPPLGPPPEYSKSLFDVQGITHRDAQVLKIFCDLAVAADSLFAIQTDDVLGEGAQLGLTHEQVIDSATVLVENGYLREAEVRAPEPPYYTVTTIGFEQYVHRFIADYDDLVTRVASEIVNRGVNDNGDLMKTLGRKDFLIVDHILEVLSLKGLIKLTKTLGHHAYVREVSPRLKRMLDGAD